MTMVGMIRRIATGLALALVVAAPATAQDFPRLTGRVVDQAGVLDAPVRAALEQQLADLEAKTTDQLVVATVRSLEGTTIEDYANRLGRQWKLGQKDKNNGVLLLVAPGDRKVRIEVGYGLEGALTDAVSKYIISESIVPHFRSNDMAGGIARGVDDIIEVLTGDASEWQRRAAKAQPSWFMRVVRGVGHMLSWIPEDFIILGILLLLSAILSLVSFAWLRICLPALLYVGIALGLLSKDRWRDLAKRQAGWHFMDSFIFSGSGSSGSSSSGGSFSSGGGGFSGGGGSFGGGGASGSW
jgi:uncharacterized protein